MLVIKNSLKQFIFGYVDVCILRVGGGMDWITERVVFSLGGMVGEIITASVRMREYMRAGNKELGADCDLC